MNTIRKEEYIEIIYDICLEKGIAKVSEIKKRLKLQSLSSVTEMVQKLHEEGLIKYEKYKGVTITEKGLSVAKQLLQRHQAIEDFLLFLQIDKKIALQDACAIEHVISEQSIEAIIKFVCFLNKKENKDIEQRVKQFLLL
ncbi:MAG: metal-dependent transcriptional regulator [Candidatus Heimdallarchaeum aukensis]|uniref:Metal-dependent transcriptional regulator n=1 Tax=Candidatus Heimdallarchaeum aukensis TaxID=2876573 RepID=A0A9Y1BIU9_9ARCH|nr:MAG: metal-dependent transcriptional regulator [Candidatus Heimdallarchaeum aukensis]